METVEINNEISRIYKKNKQNLEGSYLNWYTFGLLNDKEIWRKLLETRELIIDLEGFDLLNGDGLIWLLSIIKLRNIDPNNITIINNIINEKYQWTLENTDLINQLLFLETEIRGPYEKYIKDQKKFGEINSSTSKFQNINGFYLKNPSDLELNKFQKIKFFNKIYNDLHQLFINNYNFYPEDEGDITYIRPFIRLIIELVDNIIKHGSTNIDECYCGSGFFSFTPLPPKAKIIRITFSDIGYGLYERFKYILYNPDILPEVKENPEIKKSYEKYREVIETDYNFSEKETTIHALLFRFYNKVNQIIGIYPNLSFLCMEKGKLLIRSGNYIYTLDFSIAQNREIFTSFNDKDRKDLHFKENDLNFQELPKANSIISIFNIVKVNPIPGTHILAEIPITERINANN